MSANRSGMLEILALEAVADRLRRARVPADAISRSRFGGALLIVLLLLLLLSGLGLALYYSPVPGMAYDSVDFALFEVPFGRIVKGIHHYAWNMLLVVLGIHLIRGFIVGAYKTPRQLVWISGVAVLLVVPVFIVTGDLLPWDQKGYWSTQVRLSIIASVPVIGDQAVRLLLGGSLTGVVALTRFYVLHILLLPLVLVALVAVHFHFIYRLGLSAPLGCPKAPREKNGIERIPLANVINRWLLLFLTVTIALGVCSWYWSAPLGDPADPTDSTYVPRPEWWVLFLNQLVTVFKGKSAIVGSVLIPGGLIGFLVMLPLIDRKVERHPGRRLKLMLVAILIAIAILGLSIMGYMAHSGGTTP